ncbi:hypothetical protein CMASS_04880 [Corynebacterium massiliense DSM 45435]|uniref:Terminase small subunit n=2 Tax=Corynebacterium massiliense TaxID=441501 RepID=A0ABY7U6U8_9CORY|nr:hypothetical protein CMASS_04880 [Corynebacterium massiliense DSM 45435]
MGGLKPPTRRETCGTKSGYQAHYRAGERPCVRCRNARSEDHAAKVERSSITTADWEDVVGPMTEPPVGLGRAGLRLWAAATVARRFSPATLYLLVEACRCADVLERLDGAVRSRRGLWLSLKAEAEEQTEGVPRFDVVVDGAVAEQRRQRESLNRVLKQLDLLDVVPAVEPGREKSVLDQLRERRARREEELKNQAKAGSEG